MTKRQIDKCRIGEGDLVGDLIRYHNDCFSTSYSVGDFISEMYWLRSPNYELQAYAKEGLMRIQVGRKSIPEELQKIIEHLRVRNYVVINCAGCLMGLVTPVNQLIFESR